MIFFLNNKDNDAIVKQSFLMTKNLHSVNNSGFYYNFMNMVKQNNPFTLDPDCLGIYTIRRYTNNMEDKYYLSGDTAMRIQRN